MSPTGIRRFLGGPKATFHRGLRIAGDTRRGKNLGADWWSVYDVGQEKSLIVLGDAAGGCVEPKVLGAFAKGICDALVRSCGPRLTAADVLEQINTSTFEAFFGAAQLACVACVIDRPLYSLEVARAAHSAPYVLRTRQLQNEVYSPAPVGAPIGSEAGPRYQTEKVALRPNDVLLLSSDGVVSRRNQCGDEFGIRRFRGLLDNVTLGTPPLTVRSIRAQLGDFSEQIVPCDDETLIVAKLVPWA